MKFKSSGRAGKRSALASLPIMELLESRIQFSAGALLKDLAPGDMGSNPTQFAEVNGLIYYTTGNPGTATKIPLIVSDGTPAGTKVLGNYDFGAGPVPLGSIGNKLLYSAENSLYVTDGTVGGTVNLGAISPGYTKGATVGGFLYFGSLWRTDGTAIGTQLVKGIGGVASNFTDVDGTLYFTANDGVHGAELWKSDGTPDGTAMVQDIEPGVSGSSPANFLVVGPTLYFTASNGLWRTDTNGLTRLSSVGVSFSGNFQPLAALNGRVYFNYTHALWTTDGTVNGTSAVSSAVDPSEIAASDSQLLIVSEGDELWSSNGTIQGTIPLIKTINSASHLTPFGSEFAFAASTVATGLEPWVTDGTPAGTHIIADINPGPFGSDAGGENPKTFTVLNGSLFFTADDGVHGAELWRSDGTAPGTKMVLNWNVTPVSSDPQQFVVFQQKTYFVASTFLGTGLFRSDGTVGGTTFFAAASPNQPLAVEGNYLFFMSGTSLWRTDGTPTGTISLANLGGYTSRLFSVNGNLLVVNNYQLWRSDGSVAGTVQVAQGPVGSIDNDVAVASGGKYLFFTQSGQPWVSDGTDGGTLQLVNLQSLSARNLTPVSGGVVFDVGNGISTGQLWFSNGTTAGTHPIVDSATGKPFPIAIQILQDSGGWLLGTLNASSGKTYIVGIGADQVTPELLVTDGTSAGTNVLAKFTKGNQAPLGIVEANGAVVVAMSTGNGSPAGIDLWKTNGTAAGTQKIAFIADTYAPGSPPFAMVSLNGVVEFVTHLNQVWQSDGTTVGTVKLPAGTILPGPGVKLGNAYIYANYDSVHGMELWSAPITAPAATITGTVFNDANGNGKRDSGEAGISGRKLYIDKNKNGVLDTGEPTFTTSASGRFTISGLAAGSYRVREVQVTGWRHVAPSSGYYDVSVAAGQTVTARDFADTQKAMISGTVFRDINGNAKQDTREAGLAGWIVFIDSNNNGKLDSGELKATTDSAGHYSFVVPAGKYNVRQVIKAGFTRTTGGVYSVTLASGQIVTGRNFGNR